MQITNKLSRCAGGMNSENDKSPPAYPSPGTEFARDTNNQQIFHFRGQDDIS